MEIFYREKNISRWEKKSGEITLPLQKIMPVTPLSSLSSSSSSSSLSSLSLSWPSLNTLFNLFPANESFEYRIVNEHLENTHRGRLEIRRNQEPWGSVCMEQAVFKAAEVQRLCKTLGFVNHTMPIFAWETPSLQTFAWNDVNTPTEVGSTDSWRNTRCPHKRALHISCDPGKTNLNQT